MRTFANTNGKSVFDLKTGVELGKVQDLYIDPKSAVIRGLIMDQKGWFQSDLLIPIECIEQFGQDGVMVSSKNVLRPLLKKSRKHVPFAEGKQHIRGMPIITAEGEKLGLVEDVYFTEEMGNIIGYEISEGLIVDLKEGKKVLKTNEPLTVGEDILIVKL